MMFVKIYSRVLWFQVFIRNQGSTLLTGPRGQSLLSEITCKLVEKVRRHALATNVIVSGNISSKGAPSKILDLFFQGKVNLFFNIDMLTKIERVLSYPKIEKKYCISEEEISGILGILVRYGMLVIERGREEVIEENHSDDMFSPAQGTARQTISSRETGIS